MFGISDGSIRVGFCRHGLTNWGPEIPVVVYEDVA